jgi:hypothetical protein
VGHLVTQGLPKIQPKMPNGAMSIVNLRLLASKSADL